MLLMKVITIHKEGNNVGRSLPLVEMTVVWS